MQRVAKQLAQSRPTDTTAVSILSPSIGQRLYVMQVVVCNQTGTAATFRIFHDDDGTTYDETTALYFDKNLPANDTLRIYMQDDPGWPMQDAAENLAVRSGTGSAITYTVYGYEET